MGDDLAQAPFIQRVKPAADRALAGKNHVARCADDRGIMGNFNHPVRRNPLQRFTHGVKIASAEIDDGDSGHEIFP